MVRGRVPTPTVVLGLALVGYGWTTYQNQRADVQQAAGDVADQYSAGQTTIYVDREDPSRSFLVGAASNEVPFGAMGIGVLLQQVRSPARGRNPPATAVAADSPGQLFVRAAFRSGPACRTIPRTERFQRPRPRGTLLGDSRTVFTTTDGTYLWLALSRSGRSRSEQVVVSGVRDTPRPAQRTLDVDCDDVWENERTPTPSGCSGGGPVGWGCRFGRSLRSSVSSASIALVVRSDLDAYARRHTRRPADGVELTAASAGELEIKPAGDG